MYGDYSISGFGDMLADTVRMRAFTEALTRAITPGCTVLDLGCGPGVLSLIACKLGAGNVIAVDVNDAILLGAPLAAANGYADRIRFHHGTSQSLELDTPVDVMVSDLRGVLPWFGPHQSSIVDARQRLLKPGGVQIGQHDTVWAALVHAPAQHAGLLSPWAEGPMQLDLTPALPFAGNRWKKHYFDAAQLLTPPQQWARLDYRQWDSPNANAELTWTVEQQGTAHGLAAWFDAALLDDIGFSNAPGAPKAIYGQAYLPWPEEVCLRAGDKVTVQLRVQQVATDFVYVWNTGITSRKGDVRRFRQSSFNAAPISRQRLSSASEMQQ